YFPRMRVRVALAIVSFGTVSCGANLFSASDTADASHAADAGDSGDAGELRPVEEVQAVDDGGTYADVVSIDAPFVTSCAESGLVARWKLDEGAGSIAL